MDDSVIIDYFQKPGKVDHVELDYNIPGEVWLPVLNLIEGKTRTTRSEVAVMVTAYQEPRSKALALVERERSRSVSLAAA